MAQAYSIKCPVCGKDLPILKNKKNVDYCNCNCCFISLKKVAKNSYPNFKVIEVQE